MPDTPILLLAVLAALCMVAYVVVRTWWRGVKLMFFLFATVVIAVAVFLFFVEQH